MNMTLEELCDSWLIHFVKVIKFILIAFSILFILCAINPDLIAPFSIFEFWENSLNNWSNWYDIGRPLFAWGCGMQIFLIILLRNVFVEELIRVSFLALFILSIVSGLLEEILFRWLIFLVNIIFIKVINFLFLGWLGWGIWQALHNLIFAPMINALTLGYLHNYLANPDIWFVGASMILTNASFRDGHQYQGCLGWLNSWFIGMFLFWITFNYGLICAILIHVFYNFLVSVIIFLGYSFLIRRYY